MRKSPTARALTAEPLPAKPAESWIEEIRALKRQGKMVEAERLLNEFRMTFPNYRLPEDLR